MVLLQKRGTAIEWQQLNMIVWVIKVKSVWSQFISSSQRENKEYDGL